MHGETLKFIGWVFRSLDVWLLHVVKSVFCISVLMCLQQYYVVCLCKI